LEHVPVVGLHAPATWHWSAAEHWTGLLPVQVPLWHVSVCVQALGSLHAVPSLAFGLEHVPVVGLHVPATWHWSAAEHWTGLLPVQVPLWHVSVRVQALSSFHPFPSLSLALEHVPVVGLHAPATWHWSAAEHWTGLLPLQVPLWHVSVCV